MRCQTSLGKASAAPVVIDIQTFVRVEEGGRRNGDEEDDEVASRPDEVKANHPRPPPARAELRIHQRGCRLVRLFVPVPIASTGLDLYPSVE